jgi:hypothetical protein
MNVRIFAALSIALGSGALSAQQVAPPVSAGAVRDHVAPLITVADPAQPTPSTPNVGYNNPVYQAPYGSGFDGVARLLMTNPQGYITSGCSGSLLWTGQDVLTAAHCVTSGSNVVTAGAVYSGFLNPGGTVTNVRSSAIYVNPAYNGGRDASPNGSAIDANDIAVIHLSHPVNWITGYNLYFGNPLGQPTIFAGFGLSGNGVTGGVVNTLFDDILHTGEPVRRIALNQWDATLSSDANYISPGMISPIMLSDFDNGSASGNTLCSFFGGSTNPYALPPSAFHQVCNTGYGLYEGAIGSGDSGGPGLVWDAAMSRFEIAGVASFGSERCWNPSDSTTAIFNSNGTCPTHYQLNGGYFGSYSGHVDPSVGQNWAFLASATPEPSSLALLGTGLFAVAPAMLRRRRRLDGRRNE